MAQETETDRQLADLEHRGYRIRTSRDAFEATLMRETIWRNSLQQTAYTVSLGAEPEEDGRSWRITLRSAHGFDPRHLFDRPEAAGLAYVAEHISWFEGQETTEAVVVYAFPAQPEIVGDGYTNTSYLPPTRFHVAERKANTQEV